MFDSGSNLVYIFQYYICDTLIERKSRMPQIRGIKGEVVVVYCEPLITKEMGYYRLSRRVNKIEIK